MIVRKIVTERLFRDAILFMLNSPFWLRPFFVAVFSVVFLSSAAIAARDGSTDRPGLDYKTIELSAPNPDLCENTCKKDGKCRAWTYSWPGAKGPKAMCALKTGVPPKRSDTCCISGVISTSSPVTRTDDPAPAPPKPTFSAKPAPTQPPTKPNVVAKPVPEPAPEQPAELVKPVPVPAPEQPAELVKPVPVPAPEQPAELVKPSPKKPARQTIVKPLPDPSAAREDQERITVSPKPKPSLQQQDGDLQQEDSDLQQQATQPDTAKIAACNNYASRAIVQNDENTRLNCRFSGSLWGYSRNSYFNFCMNNPSSEYNGSRAARDSELDKCQRRIAAGTQSGEETILPDPEDNELEDLAAGSSRAARFCRNFAGQSVRQVRQARTSRCGFSGERWSSSRTRQARLCSRIGPRAATTLLNTRNRQIRDCRLSAARRDRNIRSHCRDYARTAVRQAREARRLDCGFGGRRWSLSYDRHLRWCSKLSRRQTRREYRNRERLLDRCG